MMSLPLRTLSRMPYFSSISWKAFSFAVLPVASKVIESSVRSTLRAREEVVGQLHKFGALFHGAGDLDEGYLPLDDLLAGMVGHVHHVDEFVQLLDDLRKDFAVAGRNKIHARKFGLVGRRDDHAVEVVAAAREHLRDADEHAGAVRHQKTYRMLFIWHFHQVLPFGFSTGPVGRDRSMES